MKVLIVDDDKTFRVVAQAALAAEGHEVRTARTGGEALELARAAPPDVVILDRNLPDADGLEVLPRIVGTGAGASQAAAGGTTGPAPAALTEDAPLVVMATAYGEIENAVAAMKAGAFDYLTKPIALPALVVAVNKAAAARRLRRRARGHTGASRRRLERGFCQGASAAMRQVVTLADKVARSPDTTVLVTGESGTGKELVAQRVHLHTPERGEAAFVELNCAAIPETLLEAELFGHEKGAFTDAARARPGLLEEADGGTLFLDEVGDMPLATQAKLLKVLETRTFRRLGGTRDLSVDLRFVAATHRELDVAVREGRFRLDLFHRLDVFRIQVPPLRERREDILPLARFFLEELAGRAGKAIAGLAPETEARLLAYPFPGNVRELRNVIERAVILESGPSLSPDSLLLRPVPDALPRTVAEAAGPPPTLDEMERAYMQELLLKARGNRSQVARWMGVSYPTVVKKISDYRLVVPGSDPGGV